MALGWAESCCFLSDSMSLLVYRFQHLKSFERRNFLFWHMWHRSQRLKFLQSEKEKEFSIFDAPGSEQDWSRTLSFHRDAWSEKSGADIRVFMSPQLSTAVLLFGPKTQPHHLDGLSCCLCRHVYTLQRSRVDGLLVAFQCNPSEARAWGWSPQQQPWVGLEGMSLLN